MGQIASKELIFRQSETLSVEAIKTFEKAPPKSTYRISEFFCSTEESQVLSNQAKSRCIVVDLTKYSSILFQLSLAPVDTCRMFLKEETTLDLFTQHLSSLWTFLQLNKNSCLCTCVILAIRCFSFCSRIGIKSHTILIFKA